MTKSERKRLCAACRAMFPGQKIPLFQKALRKQRKEKQEQERLTRKGERAAVRTECVKRAGGWCECGCGLALLSFGEQTAEWDEFYGRQHATVEETWMLTRRCHRLKTQNAPDRAFWDSTFHWHCNQYGYPFRPRFGGRPKADAPKVPSNVLKASPTPVASSTQEGEKPKDSRDPPPETA